MIVRRQCCVVPGQLGDSSGDRSLFLLQPVTITAPTAGGWWIPRGAGTAIHQGGLIAETAGR